jgi:hypothetical protein
MTKSATRNNYLEFDEDVLGGTELHVKYVRHAEGPGIMLEFTPPHRPDGTEEGIPDINARLSGVCRAFILDMQDAARDRFLALAERDGGADRMVYRLVVAARISGDDARSTRVLDRIDPEFMAIDAGLADRALACRQEIGRVLAGGKPRPLPGIPIPDARETCRPLTGQTLTHNREDPALPDQNPGAGPGDFLWGSAGTDSPSFNAARYLPAVPEMTEEELREGLLKGQNLLILQIQVVGTIVKEPDRESIAINYLAAMNQNARTMDWMREMVMRLTDICEQTIMTDDVRMTRRIFSAIRNDGGERCLYRLSVYAQMQDDGSTALSVSDEIDTVFAEQDPAAGQRAAEARRLAANVMEERG